MAWYAHVVEAIEFSYGTSHLQHGCQLLQCLPTNGGTIEIVDQVSKFVSWLFWKKIGYISIKKLNIHIIPL